MKALIVIIIRHPDPRDKKTSAVHDYINTIKKVFKKRGFQVLKKDYSFFYTVIEIHPPKRLPRNWLDDKPISFETYQFFARCIQDKIEKKFEGKFEYKIF